MSTLHLMCIPITYYVHMQAIGSPKGVTLLEFEAGEQEDQQQDTQGEGGQDLEDLPECPDH
jgi:hypothetical protein